MKRKIVLLFALLILTLCACTTGVTDFSPGKEEVEFIGLEDDRLTVREEENHEKDAGVGEGEKNDLNIKTYIRSKVDTLCVRTAPDLTSSKLGYLDAGDMVRFDGEKDGWYSTVYCGQKAYVSAEERYTEKVDMEAASRTIERVISVGEDLLGTPYVYGAVRLHDGQGNLLKDFDVNKFDCSSYMQYIFYYGAGAILHSTTRTQVRQGQEVDRSDLLRGDLIFMTNSSRKNNVGMERIGHVAMYLGDNYVLHTASDHAVIEQMTAARWENFVAAKRMIDF